MLRAMPEPAFTISPLALAEIDRVEPIWNALREHHGEVVGQTTRSREDAWARRRARYEEWLVEPASFALIATASDGRDVGYAVVTDLGAEITFPTERLGCLETLAVLPDARGAGVGSALITEARRRAAASGIADLTITVFAANGPALGFYERHGFAPYLHVLRGPNT